MSFKYCPCISFPDELYHQQKKTQVTPNIFDYKVSYMLSLKVHNFIKKYYWNYSTDQSRPELKKRKGELNTCISLQRRELKLSNL